MSTGRALIVREEEGGLDVRLLPITSIEVNDYNPNEMAAELYESLVEAIRDEGMMIQPILVRPHPDKRNKYILVDGEHRFLATRESGATDIPAVIVPYDETQAKVRTLSMNAIRGQNVPIKLAKIIVDLQKVYTDSEIARMAGIPIEEQADVLKLLDPPKFRADDGVRLPRQVAEKPERKQVSFLLDKNDHENYTAALKRAMQSFGDDVNLLIGHEIEDFDEAVKKAMGIAGVKARNTALAVIFKAFLQLVEEQPSSVSWIASQTIVSKAASDAAAREAQAKGTDKAVRKRSRAKA